MDATKGNIYSILNGNKQFIIPVYQRYYSWEKEQCNRLWNDIVDMQKKNKDGHFVGSIVNIAEKAMPTGVQKYMIIDGQQRLTTLSLLMIALRDYADEHPEDSTINSRRIDNMLLKNEYEVGNERYKLLLTETDCNILISLIEKKPINSLANSRVLLNYNFFVSKISGMELQPKDVYEAIGKLQIVNITLDRNVDDAQAIFESLNSTGKELSESDLIRNYVLMGLEPSEQLYIYEHIWRPMELLFDYEKQDLVMDRFFRDYLTMKTTQIPKIDRVYEVFKIYQLNCEFSTIRELCNDLLNYAKYYTNMLFCRCNNTVLKDLYYDIRDLRMEVSFPFLLRVHNDCANGIISEVNLIEIIKICISYVLRRNVCDIPTNSLNKTFATLRNKIKLHDYVNSIKAFFVLRDDYKQFPDDEKFEKSFVSRDIYNMRLRNFILSHLENYENKAPIIIENYTIEHILPQNNNLRDEWKKMLGANWRDIQKNYLHTIGNLTLTAYNSEMSDNPFMIKMEMAGGFKESALRLNAYLVKQTEWNEQLIRERARLLAQKAKQIWQYPKISDAELSLYEKEENPSSKYTIDSYEINTFTRTLFDIIDRRICNLSPNIKRDFKKLYIAYKLDTNFVDIVIQKQRLRLSLNMKFSEIHDPKNLCKDISNLGRWGNGDVEVFFDNVSEIDDIMYLINQSYNKQAEE